MARNINQLELESGADCVNVSPCLVRSFPTLSAGSPIRPGAGLGNIIEADSPGTSSYNALWLTLNKRFSRGLQFNASYTFSKSLDDVSQNNNTVLLQNSLDVGDARSLSDSDALRPDLLQAVHPTGHSAQWFSNTVTCGFFALFWQ